MTEFSGAQWCARYPTRTDVDSLAPPFRDHAIAYIAALRSASALVSIDATYRPEQRAFLMHWAWGIARGLPSNMCRPGDKPGVPVLPAGVPAMAGIQIDWTHGGDIAAARAGADAMVRGYRMQVCAALASRHIERRAIDMTISWNGLLKIRDQAGNIRTIASAPHNGSNPELIAVGKTYGVIKLLSDPPHWSDDGH